MKETEYTLNICVRILLIKKYYLGNTMRLSEIYSYINKLNIKESKLHFVNDMTLKNINNFKRLIQEIEMYELDFYNTELETLKSSELYSSSLNQLQFSSSETRSKIYYTGQYITDSIQSLQIVLSKIVPASTETDFLIKFPKPDSFQLLLKDMGEIQKHISVIVNDGSIDSTMEIHNWEYGSYWINLTLGSMLAVQILGSVTWSAAYVSTQINKQKEQELYLRQMEAKTEMIEEVRNTQKIYLDKLIDNEVEHISKEHFEDNDTQRDKKIKNTIKLFSDIILRGGEFQPSLISPKEVQESYPDFNLIETIESKVKQLPQKSSNEEK